MNILLVPGFLADTYTQIEKSYVELSIENLNDSKDDLSFIWLVPDMSNKYIRCKKPGNKKDLDKPLYVHYLQEYGIPFVVGNISKYNLISNFILFWCIFKKYRIDAVYTHFGFERFHAVFFGRIFGKVTIWTEHWNSMGTRFVQLKKLFYRLFVDYFIAVSSFISSTLPKGCNVVTVRHSIETDDKNNQTLPREVRKRLGIPQNKKVILMTADFLPEKRHDLALEVCCRVSRIRKDVLFIFLGDGAARTSFFQETAKKGLEKYISAPGFITNVDDYYAAADISMLTSIGEALGFVILEAQKHSLPVIAFNDGGPKELIKSGYSGMLVPNGDTVSFASALVELLDNPEKCRVLGENACKEVREHYDRKLWLKSMTEILKKMCTGRQVTE